MGKACNHVPKPAARIKVTKMILLLGAGWTGTKMCLRSPSRFVATTRSSEKLQNLTSKGLNVVQWDLLKEDTWCNLPPKSDIEATIITFEILASQQSQWELLWEEHIAADRPVVCFGTSSAFKSGGYDSTVNEMAPFSSHVSYSGTPMTDRVKGEEWALSKGATVLHLSGLISDEEEESRYGVSNERTAKSFLSKGYLKNGLQLLNVIHINDIYNISLLVIEKLKDGNPTVKGQRILTSCGAFRVQDFTRALNMDPLPEIIPPHSTMDTSKIISTAKLVSLLPEDYKWTLPVSGVEPVSRGLPTIKMGTRTTGPDNDKQWELLKKNFRGKFRGIAKWYKKDKGEGNGGKLEHEAFIAEMKASILPNPVIVSEDPQYYIYTLDADTLIWHGTELSKGDRIIPVYRKTYNNHGRNFCFEGLGGQCSTDTKVDLFAAEINFFYERSRSMIIPMYTLNSTTNRLLLETVVITTLRCSFGCNFPFKPPQSEVRGKVEDLIKSLKGKKCHRQTMDSAFVLSSGEECEYPTEPIQLFFDSERVVQLFDDDIVCSLPPDIQPGKECELVCGCFHTATYAQIFMLSYNSNGTVEGYMLEKWS